MMLAETDPRRLSRVCLMTFMSLLVVLIGCSRVYLGVHWPSDVVAGWCLGAVWALAGFGYPATHTYYTCNVISKILAFVTTLTLFRPRAAWAGARLRLRSGRPA